MPAPRAFAGLVAPIEHIEMIAAPRAGAILFDVKPGDRVAEGDRLATIVHAPGEEGGSTEVFAPQAGFVLTRVSRRSTRAGDDLIKLVGEKPSATASRGAGGLTRLGDERGERSRQPFESSSACPRIFAAMEIIMNTHSITNLWWWAC